MNIALWVLQVVLALHTVMGALWKFSNSEQTVPSLSAIPHTAWLGLSIIELLCAVGLVLPALSKGTGMLPPLAAAVIAAEMLLFVGLQLRSDVGTPGQLVYWLVVAALCAVIVYGRIALKPL